MSSQLNIDGARMKGLNHKILDQITEAEKIKASLGRPFNLETDLQLMPPVVQMSVRLQTEPTLQPVLGDLLIALALDLPNAIALIFSMGYMMAQEDISANAEINELEKMFAATDTQKGE